MADNISLNLTLQSLARALGGIVRNGEVLAPGPGHSPIDKSLSVKLDPDAPDGFIVHSFANDNPFECRDYVREKWGLPAFGSNGNRKPTEIKRAVPTQRVVDDATIAAALAAINTTPPQAQGKIIQTYDYTDAEGKMLYQVLRYEPKDFRQRRPNGNGGWIWNAGEHLYRLPQLLQYPDATVFVTEGEKDADRVATLELCATTVACGKWTDDCVKALVDRDVVILEDNDEAGRKKALEAATALHRTAKTIRIVRLPNLPDKGDVSDWLDADQRNAKRLAEVCFDAPVWTPETKSEAPKTKSGSIPLPFIDMSNWDDEPPRPRQWAVDNRIPHEQPYLFTGNGAVGKSLVELTRACAHVLGKHWLGMTVTQGPVIYLGAEDDADELHRRLADILTYYDASFADLIAGGLHLLSYVGEDCMLGVPDRGGMIRPTPLFERLEQAAMDIKPVAVTIDTMSDVFGGDEISRAHATQFVSMLQGMAVKAKCSVAILAHPSNAGMATGTGLSGSTGWHNKVRARAYMKAVETAKGEEPDPDLKEIAFLKNNYGRQGDSIQVRWRRGLYVLEGVPNSLEKLAQDQRDDEQFIQLLRQYDSQGRKVSDSKTANNYAPKAFAGETGENAQKVPLKRFEQAMLRLFTASKIHVQMYGRPSRPYKCIALGPKP